jgi:hypothetical protein
MSMTSENGSRSLRFLRARKNVNGMAKAHAPNPLKTDRLQLARPEAEAKATEAAKGLLPRPEGVETAAGLLEVSQLAADHKEAKVDVVAAAPTEDVADSAEKDEGIETASNRILVPPIPHLDGQFGSTNRNPKSRSPKPCNKGRSHSALSRISCSS